MNTRLVLPVLLALSPVAAAEAIAAPAQAESRIVIEEFARDKIVRIDGRVGMQTAVRFGEDETIENVAIGDSAKWQVTPNKRTDLLFVKPLELAARTNMTVITNKRDYFFDLVASPQGKAIYMLRFTYAAEPASGQASQAKAGGTAMSAAIDGGNAEAVVRAALPATDAAGPVLAWSGKGNAKLFPARIYDDGKATYLTWADDVSVPALFVKNDDGAEGPVNYAVQGSTIVIAYVPNQIVLRTGKDTATLRPLGRPAQPGGKPLRKETGGLALVTGQAIDLHDKGAK